MKNRLFNNLLLFSLFGIALGFFGMLYEGIVVIPKMLDTSMPRMLLWRDYYSAINPMIYYMPLTPMATIILVALYFISKKDKPAISTRLAWAGISQVATLAITFYVVKIIDLKLCFSNIARYNDLIPAKVVIVNILSVTRLVVAGTALVLTFKAYAQTQKTTVPQTLFPESPIRS